MPKRLDRITVVTGHDPMSGKRGISSDYRGIDTALLVYKYDLLTVIIAICKTTH